MNSFTEPISQSKKELQWIYSLGYLLLVLSFTLFVIVDYSMTNSKEDFTVFFIHYFVALAYLTVLITNKAFGLRGKESTDKFIILLNLFLISAYSLNKQIPVFEDSTDWFCVYLILTSVCSLTYRFSKSLPSWVVALQNVVLGSALILYTYLSIYVSNVYFFGGIGIIAFGIGAHAFVPLLLLIATVVLLKHSYQGSATIYQAGIGGVITIAVVIVFAIEWNSRVESIERMANQSVLNPDLELPEWARIGETINDDWVTQRVLKSGLIYTTYNLFSVFSFRGNSDWEETKKHDPLVFIGSIVNECSLSTEDRIKILESISDNRHRSQERLWSGDNLSTSYIVSDVDIYPDLRLAYTEKYLTIKNNAVKQGRWLDSQEGIYTFQLPEGSVVTSLSLWVNGIEQKSILTSKQKAQKAYTAIVGGEARDPSVIHWQEGNTVSARIFPCTPAEERKFKIGITSPMPEKDGRITYKNVTFRGPNASTATETVRVRFIGKPSELQMPSGFEKNVKGEYLIEHRYDPDLSISFSAMPIRENGFSFDGFTYSIAPFKPELHAIKFEEIFLDINNTWSKEELKALWPLVKDRKVFVAIDGEFIKLDTENWSNVTFDLLHRNFSLFPFHKMKNEDRSIVISKGKELSPHLKDIEDSPFAKKVSDFFGNGHRVRLYNLGEDVSTYIGSLREFRALKFTNGNLKQLKELLQNDQFPETVESEDKIVLHDANLLIQKNRTDTSSTLKNSTPDHLARLFAYNDIMRKVDTNYFKNDFINEELVDEAAKAYVVSPVSSLIVLETKEDYERFRIKDSENSLHNASRQSSGAVPEPHEWALIILFAALVLYSVARRHQFKIVK